MAEVRREFLLEHDHILAWIEPGDRDRAGRALVGTLIQGSNSTQGVKVERKDIVTFADVTRLWFPATYGARYGSLSWSLAERSPGLARCPASSETTGRGYDRQSHASF